MVKTACQLAVLFAFLMQSTTTPLRIGEVLRQSTEEDIAAAELALPPGAKAWLLVGDRVMAPGEQVIQAFLTPTTDTPALRRGTVVSITRWVIRQATPWTAARTESYAQVAIAGRNFDDIQGDQDMNRPFRIVGRFDDDELVRLVELLRTDPPVRGP